MLQIKRLYSQNLLVHELKFPGTKTKLFTFTIFYIPLPGCYTGKMLFANASKIITNWFLTLQPDIFEIICNLQKCAQEWA